MAKDDLDDFDFDDIDIPDFDTDGLSEPKDDRKPVEKVATGFVRGLGNEALNRSTQRRVIENALPKGYGKALTELDSAISAGKDLYDTAAAELAPAKKSLKKIGRAANSRLKGILPDSISKKLDELTSDNEEASLNNIDPEATEISSTLTQIFGAQQEEEAKQRVIDEVKESARFKTSTDILNAIRTGINRQVAYQDKVSAQVQRKSLELQYKQYFISKRQYELLEAFTKESKVQQDNIVKNTALPDFVKLRTSEAAKEMVRQRLLGKITGTVSEFTSTYREKLLTNIKQKVKDVSGQLREGIIAGAGSLDMASDMEGIDQTEMAGEMAAGLLADPLATKIGQFLGKYLKGSDVVNRLGYDLEYYTDNKNELLMDLVKGSAKLQTNNVYLKGASKPILSFKDMLTGTYTDVVSGRPVKSLGDINGPVADRDGKIVITEEDFNEGLDDDMSRGNFIERMVKKTGGKLSEFLGEMAPTYNPNFSVKSDSGTLAEELVAYNALTEKSITEIIPGLLTEILHETEMMRLQSEDVERRAFNFETDKIDRVSGIKDSIINRIIPKDLKSSVKDSMAAILKALDPNESLSKEARSALMKQFLKDATDGDKAFKVERIMSPEGLGEVKDPIIQEEIRNFFVDNFLNETGNFDNKSLHATRTRKETSEAFRELKDKLPDYQTEIKRMKNNYGLAQLQATGMITGTDGNLDFIRSLLLGTDGPKPTGGGQVVSEAETKAVLEALGLAPQPEIPTISQQPVQVDPDSDPSMGEDTGMRRVIMDEFDNLLGNVMPRLDANNNWLERIYMLLDKFNPEPPTGGTGGDGGGPKPKPSPKRKSKAKGERDHLPQDFTKYPSFDGGGSIPDGPREKGVDGKGGFWALLHPGETVSDPTNPDGHKNPIRNFFNRLKIEAQTKTSGLKLPSVKGLDLKEKYRSDLDEAQSLLDELLELNNRRRKFNPKALFESLKENVSKRKDIPYIDTTLDRLAKITEKRPTKLKTKVDLSEFKESGEKVVKRISDAISNKGKSPNIEKIKDRGKSFIQRLIDSLPEGGEHKPKSKPGAGFELPDDHTDDVAYEVSRARYEIVEAIKEYGGIGGIPRGLLPSEETMSRAKDGIGNLFGLLKGKVNGVKDTIHDIYVKGSLVPSIEAHKLRMGFYRDQLTGEVITKYEDIKGPVVDQYGAIVISVQDIVNGLLDQNGKPAKFLTSLQAKKDSVFEYANDLFGAAKMYGNKGIGKITGIMGSIGEAIGVAKRGVGDIYLKGLPEPIIKLRDLELGRYRDQVTGKIITSFDDLKNTVIDENGNVVLTVDDIKKNLLLDRFGKKLNINWKGIRETTGTAINKVTGGLNTLLGGYGAVLKQMKDFAVAKYNEVLDIYVNGDPEPRLRAVVLKNGGYLSKHRQTPIYSIDDVDGEVVDLDGNVVISNDDIKKGLMTARGRVLGNLKSTAGDMIGKGIGFAKSTLNGGMAIAKKMLSKLKNFGRGMFGGVTINSSRDDMQLEYLDMIYDLLDQRIPKQNVVNNDTDGNGFTEGSWQDKLADKNAGKETLTDKKEKPLAKKKEKETKEGGGILSKLTDMLSGGKGFAGKAMGALGKVAKLGGAAVMGLGSMAMSAGGALLSGLGALASGVASVVSAPVVLGAAAVAAVAYGGYLAYKHLYKAPSGPIHRVRLAQYGVDPDNKDQLGRVSALESRLWEEVQFNNNGAEIGSGIDDKELYEFFGVNVEDQDATARFNEWYINRFKPVFILHATVLNKLSPGTEISDSDKGVADELKVQYLNSVKFPATGNTPYAIMTSPFDDGSQLVGVNFVQKEFAEAMKKYAKEGQGNSAHSNTDVAPNPAAVVDTTLGNTTKQTSNTTPKSVVAPTDSSTGSTDTTSTKSTFKPTLVVVPKSYDGPITGLLAVKMRTYGLTSMDKVKIGHLVMLESSVLADSTKSGGALKFDQKIEPYFNKYGPVFGCDVSNSDHKTAFITWFNNRFLPTFLTYANTAMAIKSGIDIMTIHTTLKGADALQVGRATYQALNGASNSVWRVISSPWPGYVLGNDPKSVLNSLTTMDSVVEDIAEEPSSNGVDKPKVNTTKDNTSKTEDKAVKVKDAEKSAMEAKQNVIATQQNAIKQNQAIKTEAIESILKSSLSVQTEIRDILLTMVKDGDNTSIDDLRERKDAGNELEEVLKRIKEKKAASAATPPTPSIPNMNMGR